VTTCVCERAVILQAGLGLLCLSCGLHATLYNRLPMLSCHCSSLHTPHPSTTITPPRWKDCGLSSGVRYLRCLVAYPDCPARKHLVELTGGDGKVGRWVDGWVGWPLGGWVVVGWMGKA